MKNYKKREDLYGYGYGIPYRLALAVTKNQPKKSRKCLT